MPVSSLVSLSGKTYQSYSVRLWGRGSQKDGDNVAVTSMAYDRMAERNELIDDLDGGRDRMIDKATRWLPMETKEEPDAYLVRLWRSFLYPGLTTVLDDLSRKPFQKQLVVGQDALPERLKVLVDDVDYQKTPMTAFSMQFLRSAIKYGHSCIYIDFPTVPLDLTLEQEMSIGARPYWILLEVPQIIGWRERRNAKTGQMELKQLRFTETRSEPVGKYGDRTVNYIRVVNAPEMSQEEADEMRAMGLEPGPELTRGSVEVWREKDDEKGVFAPAQKLQHTFPGIPLVILPLNMVGFMESSPPLKELAEQNLAHWQSYSDQRNILRYVSIAMMLIKGLRDDEEAGPIQIGPNRAIRTTNTEADIRYVEHSGQGIGSLEKEVDRIERRMEIIGLQPLLQRTPGVTATAEVKESQKSVVTAKSWVRKLEQALKDAIVMSGKWIGEEIDTQGEDSLEVDVFDDFEIAVRSQTDIAALLAARKEGEIPRETYLKNIKARGLLREDDDVKEIMELLDQEEEEARKRQDDLMKKQAEAKDGEAKQAGAADDEEPGQEPSGEAPGQKDGPPRVP